MDMKSGVSLQGNTIDGSENRVLRRISKSKKKEVTNKPA
jgi:hypothetical protein